ncbi:MAG: DUF6399 domain-containing protein [Crocosphaera sp.]|jgi:hypothetical protein
MNLRERCTKVFCAGYQFGKTSFRRLASKINLSKSSVHRLYHRINSRNQHPESCLWETDAGQKWLKLLVLATLFIFSLQGGIGCEKISQFFHLLRLHKHIGVSPTALRSLRASMESKILSYHQQQQEKLPINSDKVELCLAADETFFDEVILVMLDLPSGYIFVEEKTENCQYETWQQRVTLALKPLNVTIKYLVSDRAKAIVKMALTDLGTHSISDLFHVLYNLNRSIAWELNCLSSRLQKQLKQAQDNPAKSGLIETIETSIKILQQSRLTYNDSCYGLTKYLHPFDIERTTITTTQIVSIKLTKILHTIEDIRTNHKLKDPRNGIRNLKNQIPYLSSIIDIWWSWVDQCLIQFDCQMSVIHWVKEQLLPTVYWQQQIKRTKNPHLRKDYQKAYLKANASFQQHPITLSLTQLDQDSWWNWAIWMVSKFQRSSSAVEGRNGYLSQVYHNRRGLSIKRLQVATVIHNFFIKRSDGTTAAQRLFGQEFPDLFEYLVENIGELPQPRKSRKSSTPQTFSLPTVPS